MLQTHPVRFFSGYKLIHHRQSARPPSAHHSWCYQTCLFSCPNSGPEELGLIPSQTLLARVLGRMPQQASVSREPIKCLGIRSVWTGLQQDFWETENTVLERSVAIRVSFCHLSSNNFKMGLLIFYMCFPLQSCLTLCNTMDNSLQGFSVQFLGKVWVKNQIFFYLDF